MKVKNIAGYNGVNAFVDGKMREFRQSPHTFSSLYRFMFSERENVMFEKSEGFETIKTTYGQCFLAVERKAAALKRLLDGRTGTVAVYLESGRRWIETFWAVLRCGCDPLLLNMRLDTETLQNAMREFGATAVISEEAVFDAYTVRVSQLDEEAGVLPEEEPFGKQIYVMSSGTSGNVKICAYSAEEFFFQIQDSCDIIRRCRRIKRHYKGELKLLTFLPFYHIFGLVAVYMWFAFFSRTFVELKDLGGETILTTVRRHKVTHIFAVPLFWNRICTEATRKIREKGEKTYAKFRRALDKANDGALTGKIITKLAFGQVRDNLFGDSVQFCICGGSVANRQTFRFFNGIGYSLHNGYGSTEIGITSVELSEKRKILNSLSVGKPFSSVRYEIREGTLRVAGKTSANTIFERGKARANEGFFDTHDLAEERGGRYYILGRTDDVLVSATGENLNPNLVEPHLETEGAKGVCLVAGGGVLPTLLVFVNRYLPREKAEKIYDDVKQKVAALNLTGQIGKITLVSGEMFAENEGKLNRKRIEKDFSEGKISELTFRADGEDSPWTRKVAELFAETLHIDVADIGAETDFFDEGGTSLDYFSLLADMRSTFEVEFSLEERLRTVGEFCRYLETHG